MAALEISVDDLQLGMYVSQLDRPWLGTPYLLEGVMIQSQEDIDQLAQLCQTVFVDETTIPASFKPKRIILVKASSHTPEVLTSKKTASDQITPGELEKIERTPFHGNQRYTDIHPVDRELPVARQALEVSISMLEEIHGHIEHGVKLDYRHAKEVVESLRESVVRNPDALLLLSRLRKTRHELYEKSVRSSVYLLALGRHLGLPREELSALGMGGLLMDVGQAQLPVEIQKKTGKLSTAEHEIFKRHVAYGETSVATTLDISEAVLAIVAQHHERENGSGYPRGLFANQLHPYARMAAVIDSYESLIEPARDMPAFRPFEALRELQTNSRGGLNSTLVEQFCQFIGVFPIGSLVELNTGEVAIVLAHNRTQRFRPKIMVILDAKKKPHESPRQLDLRLSETSVTGIEYEIKRDLALGAFGIDVSRYYLG
ncbi:HD-GYP domain-containing protein [Nitrosomonas mobilis]|uniref:Metal dependent phosphohydrolase n=1 Tax=Nitrosomonas mobilis TaxID=51642 RepID=A0A1G5SI63_9PROT|nr:HD-GYP domain-containing protein [Nitrosomonas mobilis]SCZ86241.1 Metal dependent phosphohydrolase [Nitrosomonas mobilis]